MKIQKIKIQDYPPIKNLQIDDIGNVLIIAGANGSGKTRLKNAILETLQGNVNTSVDLQIQSTRKEEKDYFRGEILEVKSGIDNTDWFNYFHSRKYGRGNYVGSIVQIDSQRDIKNVTYNPISYLTIDPDENDESDSYYIREFTNRWQSFMDYIHQKVAAYRIKLSEEVEDPNNSEIMTKGEILKKYPRPLDKYKVIFQQILLDKELQDIDPVNPNEFQYQNREGAVLPFSTLSSGEQEVIKILFDILQKDIKHSVILMDEPELHLHPTLTFKLIETLKTIGNNTNQFIFFTHSADLISTYYSTGNVYFIDSEKTGENEAHKLSELDHSHKTLSSIIGNDLGLFAVGKKIVFVEGEDSSLDRLTYNTIAKDIIPEAKITPVGSVHTIETLNSFADEIQKSIFGIDFYMIRDRDGMSQDQITQVEKSGKVKILKRRHIENYFLDSEMLYAVAQHLALPEKNLEITQQFIEEQVKEIAKQTLQYNLLQNTKEYIKLNYHINIPTVKDIEKNTCQEVQKLFLQEFSQSVADLTNNFSQHALKDWMDREIVRLERCLKNGNWINEFQGKVIFSKICGDTLKTDVAQVRKIYIDITLEQKQEVFQDIKDILKSCK